MSGLDGWRLARLRHDPDLAAFRALPIIFLTPSPPADAPGNPVEDLGVEMLALDDAGPSTLVARARALACARPTDPAEPGAMAGTLPPGGAGASRACCCPYRDLLDHATVSIFVAQDGLFKYANPCCAELLATPVAELVGRSFIEYVHEDDRAMVADRHRRRQSGEVIADAYEFRVLGRGRLPVWMHISASRVLWEGRAATLIVFTDVTRRHQAEEELQEARDLLERRVQERTFQLLNEVDEHRRSKEALQESRERFRIVADWTYDWETWVDAAGRLLYTSPSVERVTGYSVEALMADPMLMLRMVHQDDRAMWEDHVHHCHRKTSETGLLTFRVVTPGGEVRWIEHVCLPVRAEDGRYLGRRASGRDITEKVESKRALQWGTPAPGVDPRGYPRRDLGVERADGRDALQRALGPAGRLHPGRADAHQFAHLDGPGPSG